jgi:hypothetical protein
LYRNVIALSSLPIWKSLGGRWCLLDCVEIYMTDSIWSQPLATPHLVTLKASDVRQIGDTDLIAVRTLVQSA